MKIRVMIAVCAAKFVGYVCKEKWEDEGVTVGKEKWRLRSVRTFWNSLSSQVTKGYFCNLRYKWKDNYQQYALCGTGSGRTESNL